MPIVIPPGLGTALGGTFEVVIKVRGRDTGGVMAVIEETVPPRTLISPHTHRNDVWVHVLEGEIGVLVGDDIEEAGRGAWALKPRSVIHAMWNASESPARIIEVLTPAGSENWFEELAALEKGDREGFEASCRKHGIEFLDSPKTDEIRRRYNL